MNDPVIDEVRRVRKLISDEIGSDLCDLVEHYAKYQSRFKRKSVQPTDHAKKRSVELTDPQSIDDSPTASTR